MEDFSLGCSGPTSVAAPATVARFVADGDSAATITKPIPSSGEERESNPGHFTGTGQHSHPLHEGNGAKTLIGSPIPLLPYLLCLGQGSGVGWGMVLDQLTMYGRNSLWPQGPTDQRCSTQSPTSGASLSRCGSVRSQILCYSIRPPCCTE